MPTTTTGLDVVVIDRRSSIPLGSAVINVVRDEAHLTTEHADVHGRVSVDLPEGAFDVMVSAGGYVASLFRGVGVLAGQRVEIVRALGAGEGRVEEPPAGAIGGRCLDRLDQPLANIIVQAMSDTLNYTVRSDKHGCYMLNGVQPGKYRVTWRSGDRALLTQEMKVERPRQFIRFDAQLLFL